MGEWTDSETERDESVLDCNSEYEFLPTQEELELFLAADDDSTDETNAIVCTCPTDDMIIT